MTVDASAAQIENGFRSPDVRERRQTKANHLFKGFLDLARTGTPSPDPIKSTVFINGTVAPTHFERRPDASTWRTFEPDQLPEKPAIVKENINRLMVGTGSTEVLTSAGQQKQEAVVIQIEPPAGHPHMTIELVRAESDEKVIATIYREKRLYSFKAMLGEPYRFPSPEEEPHPLEHYDEMTMDLLNEILINNGKDQQ